MVQVSTDEVYGSVATGSWTEDAPLAPNSPVRRGEGRAATSWPGPTPGPTGCNVSITRCCNNYGPYQYPEKVIPLFVTNLLDGLHGPALRRRPQRPRAGSTSTTTAGASSWCSSAASRAGVYHINGDIRADQPGADRGACSTPAAPTGTW